uniref:Secreted protein n=1 Tax=Parascaris equorum TaxID=6256 RepID=A0A914RTX0_PAREQ
MDSCESACWLWWCWCCIGCVALVLLSGCCVPSVVVAVAWLTVLGCRYRSKIKGAASGDKFLFRISMDTSLEFEDLTLLALK